MKKLLKIFAVAGAFACFGAGDVEAAKVALVLDAPLYYVHDAKGQEEIMQKAAELFPEPKFSMTPLIKTLNEVQLYREENGLAAVVTNANGGEVSYEWELEPKDIAALGQKLNCDYILNLHIIGNRKDVANFMQAGIKASVVIDAKIYSCSKKQNIAVQKIAAEEEKMNNIINILPIGGSKATYKKSFAKAMKTALAKLQIDTSTL